MPILRLSFDSVRLSFESEGSASVRTSRSESGWSGKIKIAGAPHPSLGLQIFRRAAEVESRPRAAQRDVVAALAIGTARVVAVRLAVSFRGGVGVPHMAVLAEDDPTDILVVDFVGGERGGVEVDHRLVGNGDAHQSDPWRQAVATSRIVMNPAQHIIKLYSPSVKNGTAVEPEILTKQQVTSCDIRFLARCPTCQTYVPALPSSFRLPGDTLRCRSGSKTSSPRPIR